MNFLNVALEVVNMLKFKSFGGEERKEGKELNSDSP